MLPQWTCRRAAGSVNKRMMMTMRSCPRQHGVSKKDSVLLLASSCSFSTLGPPLAKWHAALEKIPPIDLNDFSSSAERRPTKQEIYVQALQGDKILGHLVTTALIQNNQVAHDTGSLTMAISRTVSNQVLAHHAPQILTSRWNLQGLSTREMGTCVEAAVAAVYNLEQSCNQHQQGPVHDLVDFLVQARAAETAESERNPKSRLLELGGTIEPARRTAGTDHNPVFTTVAQLEQAQAVAQGSTKKQAEMLAAAQLLYQISDDDTDNYDAESLSTRSLWYSSNNNNADDNEIEFKYNQWKPFQLPEHSITLKGTESPVEWWMRGATIPKDAMARAIRAPLIFPQVLAAVDAWIWRSRSTLPEHENSNSTCCAFGMIVTHKKCVHVPVQSAPTANQAKRLVGLQANRQIAQLVGISLNDEEE